MTDYCEHSDLISTYVDGELTAEEKKEIDAHIQKCEECSRLLGLYRDISSALEGIDEPAPEDLRANIMNRISRGKGNGGRWFRPKRLMAVAATFFVVVSVVFLIMNSFGQSTGSDVTVLDVLKSASSGAMADEVQPNSSSPEIHYYEYPKEGDETPKNYADYDRAQNDLGRYDLEEVLKEAATEYGLHSAEATEDTVISVNTDDAKELLEFSGKSEETEQGNPVYQIKVTGTGDRNTGEDGHGETEENYLVWAVGETILVQRADGMVYKSVMTLEDFRRFLEECGID